MRPLLQEYCTSHAPESLTGQLQGESGLVLLRTGLFASPQTRFSFVSARPFLIFRSFGSRCESWTLKYDWHSEQSAANAGSRSSAARHPIHAAPIQVQFGDPWRLLESWLARFELLDEVDLPFPLGGCFGYWGYDLKNFVEPKLRRRANADLGLPDCQLGFYASLVAFDHHLGKTWIIATGLDSDGSRTEGRAREQLDFWQRELARERRSEVGVAKWPQQCAAGGVFGNLTRAEFIARVVRAQAYIRSGDIYQINLSHRLTASWPNSGWDLFCRLSEVSPAPFSAWLEGGDFQIASSSPESFLRISGAQIQTRPIKGTRPRAVEPSRDAQLAYELQTSAKEVSELIMITDLLRSDLGKVCEFGSVHVPELIRLERYPQVQHLVSTVEGQLRSDLSHLEAFCSCFPGGSITGAPKFRAMEIIDELEPLSRGPYTGALGYLGFNRESQLSIIIRAAICKNRKAHFQVGAGIVADSEPVAEYEETLAKARGFFEALRLHYPRELTTEATGPQSRIAGC
jgi:anthranilate/para-aminobenzoate synthase component I